MGRASRWFRGLLGLKKEREQNGLDSSNVTATYAHDRKEKKRWSFAKPGKDSGGQIPLADDFNECSWRRSYIAAESEDEQNKHAIAVAAATAAAADAAVFAAQAAVAVVRLTSNNRGALFVGNRERLAATRIQSVFRGYLARKALRALRGLVKLQALVRGFLVRKRASAALSCMEALVRAQIAVKLQRSRRSFNKENRFQPRKSMEKRLDDSKTQFHSKRLSTSYETTYNLFSDSPKIVEVDTYKPRSRSRRVDNFEDHTVPVSSPLLYQVPTAIAIPDNRFQDLEWSFVGDEIKFSTAHNTPRFRNSARANSPATPAKSVCGDGYYKDFTNSPNYMSSTKSYMAKLRSNSAPKQRPEPAPKKMMSLSEIMASRRSVSGVRMHRVEPENQTETHEQSRQ